MPTRSTAEVIEYFSSSPTVIALTEICREKNVPLFLVGGAIRDCFLDRETKNDWDFFVQVESQSVATEILKEYTSRFEAGRLPNASHPDGVDLSPTKNIIGTVQQFDMSLHGIVFDCQTKTISDPNNGIPDIVARKLRIPHPPFFITGPTAFFRPFRIALELGFDLDPQVIEVVKTYRLMVSEADRILRAKTFVELMKFFSVPSIKRVWPPFVESGIIEAFFPMLVPLSRVPAKLKPDLTHLAFNLKMVELSEELLEALPPERREVITKRSKETHLAKAGRFQMNYSPLSDIRLAALLCDVGTGLLTIDPDLPERFQTPEYAEVAFQRTITVLGSSVSVDPGSVERMKELARVFVLGRMCEEARVSKSFAAFRQRFHPDNIFHHKAVYLSLLHAMVAHRQNPQEISKSEPELFEYLCQS